MASEVGNGQVAIFPVFKGFKGAVAKEVEGSAKAGSSTFSRVFQGVGQKTGVSIGRDLKKGVTTGAAGAGSALAKKLGTEVAAASKQVSAARLKEQDATGKLRVAEAQLAEVRSKNAAGSARVVAAEEKAASAARGLASAQDTTKAASSRLTAAQARVASSSTEAGSAAARSSVGFRAAASAMGGLQRAAGGLGRLLATGFGIGIGVSAVNALGNGVRRLTSYIGESISTAAGWQVLNSQSGAVIKSTGGAAGVTAKQVFNLSQALENQTATEAEAIQNGANLLLTFTNIRNEAGKGNKIFDRTTATAVDMAKALGIDVSAAAMQLGKALNDPAKGLTKLQRSGVTFTDQQKDQVKALVASGKTLEAQKIILGELNKEFGGSGAAYAKTYEGALYRIKDAAGDFGASIVSKALPAITHLLDTGADLINWAGGTNVVQDAALKLATGVGTLADKALALTTSLKGKNPLEGIFKIALPNVDFGQFTAGIKTAIGVAQPILGAFLSYVRNIGPGVGGALAAIGPALAGVFTQIGPALQQALPLLGQAFVTLLPSGVQILQALIPLLPPIAQIIVALSPAIKLLADGLSFLITNGLVPLVQFQAGIGAVFTAFRNGSSVAGVALQGLSGKFGPVFQAVTQFAVRVGTSIRSVIGFFSNLAGNVGSFMGRVASAVGSGIARAIAFFQRIGQIPGIAARAIGGFLSSVVSGLGRAASAVGSGIGRIVSTIGQLPGRAVGVLSGLSGRLFSSGAALIQGFINGISSKIGQIAGVAGRAVSEAAKYFPHSPAKKGAFSGRGWTLYSGRATITDYARGMQQATPLLTRASDAATRAAVFTAKATRAVAPSSTVARNAQAQQVGDRPIVMDGNLFGVLRQLANGEATIVLNTQNTAISSKQRQGRRSLNFAR